MLNHWSAAAVIYHIYSLSIAQAPFRNDGVQRDATPELAAWAPHIQELGANTVLLSPVMLSSTHGYDVANQFEIDNRIGTKEGFAQLVQSFHERGIRVVLDAVFNHTGREFWAFQELLAGKGYADWYSGVTYDRQSPLGDPFDYDTWSGYHELPKLNLANPAVRDHLIAAASYWIDEFDIDGLRLDAANELDFEFLEQLRQAVTAKKPDFWLMGEVVHGDYGNWVKENRLDSVTNYKLFKALCSSHNDRNLYELADTLEKAEPNRGKTLTNFLDNHDQPRIASAVDNPEFLNTLYALLFTLPGVPAIYYGSEWGLKGVKTEGSDEALRPYVDIENPPYSEPQQLPDYLKRLISIRSQSEALKYGDYRQVSLAYRQPLVFERASSTERVFVAVNPENQAANVNLGAEWGGELEDLLTGNRFFGTEQITVEPFSARLLRACLS